MQGQSNSQMRPRSMPLATRTKSAAHGIRAVVMAADGMIDTVMSSSAVPILS
jgi:hypothetical protein